MKHHMDQDASEIGANRAAAPPPQPPVLMCESGCRLLRSGRRCLITCTIPSAACQSVARPHDYYRALALAIRDRMQHRWINTSQTYFDLNRKVACYLSAEFLMGPHLGNNLVNLHLEQEARKAMADLGHDLDTILACEGEPGLGNGGLGRLAACYLDSLATLRCPAIGYGIRYEFGIFEQEIRDGWQAEITDKWLRRGNPWEIAKPDVSYYVNWGGHTEYYRDETGCQRVRWIPHRVVKGVAYDTPIQGYGVNTCNTLRLWGAEAVESFDFQAFNVGDYYQAVNEKLVSETVTKVLYPNDEPAIGKRAAPGAAVFLRDLLAAGHAASARLGPCTGRKLRRALCRAAQRHAPFHRRGGAYAVAGG